MIRRNSTLTVNGVKMRLPRGKVAHLSGSVLAGTRHLVYCRCMSRTNVDVDDEACAEVMRRYRLRSKREAVNFALRTLAAEPFSVEEARRLRGTGWEGDLDEMRARRS